MAEADATRNTPVEAATDAALLSRVRRGQSDAARELYARYADRLRTLAKAKSSPLLANRLDSSDVVQSVFRTFFRRAADGEYSLPEGDELWQLFVVIGLNKIRATGRHHRAAKRDLRRNIPLDTHDPVSEDETALHVLKLTVDELLEPFPESSREVIRLRLEGCDVAEIAHRTQRAKRSVERILQQFRTLLQEQLHESD